MFESAAKQKGPSPQQTSQQTSPLAPQLSYGTSPDLSRSQGPERFPIGSSQPSTSKNAPRQTGIVTTAQTPEYDEQRRFLEDALNSGRIPAALLPPNGFGIGFGAGMGGFRQPQEFDTKSVTPPKKTSGTPDKLTMPKGSDGPDESDTKRHIKKASTVKTGPAKKTAGPGAPKARSADRIAHNDVERKYRTNLKHRIAELRAAVPALQTSGAEGDAEGAGGGSGNAKISKVGGMMSWATDSSSLSCYRYSL